MDVYQEALDYLESQQITGVYGYRGLYIVRHDRIVELIKDSLFLL